MSDIEQAEATLLIDDGVGEITLRRPANGNALSDRMTIALVDCILAAAHSPGTRSVLLNGEGRHFCTGGDIAAFAADLDLSLADLVSVFGRRMQTGAKMIMALAALQKPLVAQAAGIVAGGGLSLLCLADHVVADDRARFSFSQVNVGLPPDAGLSWLLPRVVGDRAARRLILNGLTIGAQEALDLGLVSAIVGADDLEAAGHDQARRFASGSAGALAAAKGLLSAGEAEGLMQRLDLERLRVLEGIVHEDFREGVTAMLERRAPVFGAGRIESQ